MKRSPLILAGIAVLAMAMFALAACDDEDTQAEANEAFCDAAANYIAALRDVQDLDTDSTTEEVEEAADVARDAYDEMIEASAQVVEVRLDAVQDARDDLQTAIDNVGEETSIGDALDEVDDEITNVVSEVAQVLNGVACSVEPSSGDTSSDE